MALAALLEQRVVLALPGPRGLARRDPGPLAPRRVRPLRRRFAQQQVGERHAPVAPPGRPRLRHRRSDPSRGSGAHGRQAG